MSDVTLVSMTLSSHARGRTQATSYSQPCLVLINKARAHLMELKLSARPRPLQQPAEPLPTLGPMSFPKSPHASLQPRAGEGWVPVPGRAQFPVFLQVDKVRLRLGSDAGTTEGNKIPAMRRKEVALNHCYMLGPYLLRVSFLFQGVKPDSPSSNPSSASYKA